MLPKLTALAAAFTLLVACNQNQASPNTTSESASFNKEEVKATIDSSNEQFGTAFAKGDSAVIVALYDEEAEVYPPNMKAFENRKDMGSLATQIPKMGISNTRLEAKEVLGGPDYAIEVGSYKMGDSTKDIDNGKYIVIWKKEDGKWKMYRDIWNSDNPPPPPQK